MSWLRVFRWFLDRVRTPEPEAYLREHERERELGMQQIKEMMAQAPHPPRVSTDREPK